MFQVIKGALNGLFPKGSRNWKMLILYLFPKGKEMKGTKTCLFARREKLIVYNDGFAQMVLDTDDPFQKRHYISQSVTQISVL